MKLLNLKGMHDMKNENKPHYLPIFMSIGLSVGVAIGAATNNIPLYMCIGLAIGLCIGTALDSQKKKREIYLKKTLQENYKFPDSQYQSGSKV